MDTVYVKDEIHAIVKEEYMEDNAEDDLRVLEEPAIYLSDVKQEVEEDNTRLDDKLEDDIFNSTIKEEYRENNEIKIDETVPDVSGLNETHKSEYEVSYCKEEQESICSSPTPVDSSATNTSIKGEETYGVDKFIDEHSTKSSTNNKIIIFQGDFQRHLDKDANFSLLKCQFCMMIFTCKSTLQLHIKAKHTNEMIKMYKCTVCSYITNYKNNLKRHLNMHNGIKPFQCKICKRRFGQKRNLNLHLNMHAGVKPLQCNICKVGFSGKQYLKEHMKDEHAEEENVKYLKCTLCSYETNQKEELDSHIKTHNKVQVFYCEICEVTFVRKTNFARHMKRKHTERYKNLKTNNWV